MSGLPDGFLQVAVATELFPKRVVRTVVISAGRGESGGFFCWRRKRWVFNALWFDASGELLDLKDLSLSLYINIYTHAFVFTKWLCPLR